MKSLIPKLPMSRREAGPVGSASSFRKDTFRKVFLLFSALCVSGLSTHAFAETVLPVDSVVASSNETGNTPENTIDGDPNSRWAANGIGQWIRYDLGEVVSLSEVEISWFNGSSRVYVFQVQTSVDAANWTTVYDGASSGQVAGMEPYPLTPSEGRYLRIVGLGNSDNNWISIYLTSILGDDGDQGYSDEDIIAAGLVAWNKPDGDGISCAECHTPFGYDVAIFDFDQEDLRRATAPHLTDDDADDIFAMLEVLRDWYPPEGGLKDVETFRPFQPGGEVLGGAESSLQDRDDAFALHLGNNLNLRITQSSPISTLADANLALDELMAVDLTSLPIGIKLNRWSESVSRSGPDEGGRVAEWIPGMGLQPIPEHEEAWMDLVDDYIAYPSDENFWEVFHKVDFFLDFDPVNSATLGSKADRWMRMTKDIYRSNNLFAHNELNKAIGAPELQFSDGVEPFPDQVERRQNEVHHNAHMAFMWEVGDMARQLDGGGHNFEDMPLRHQETLFNPGGNESNRRITDLRTTWMWIGFTMNPSMLHSGGGATLSLEYMMNWMQRPNRTHYAFAQAMLMTHRGFYQAETNGNITGDYFMPTKSKFFDYNRYQNHTWDHNPGAVEIYRSIIANFHRAVLIRKTHEINTHGRHWVGESRLIDDAEIYRTAMNWADPAHQTLNDQIVDDFLLAVQNHPQ